MAIRVDQRRIRLGWKLGLLHVWRQLGTRRKLGSWRQRKPNRLVYPSYRYPYHRQRSMDEHSLGRTRWSRSWLYCMDKFLAVDLDDRRSVWMVDMDYEAYECGTTC